MLKKLVLAATAAASLAGAASAGTVTLTNQSHDTTFEVKVTYEDGATHRVDLHTNENPWTNQKKSQTFENVRKVEYRVNHFAYGWNSKDIGFVDSEVFTLWGSIWSQYTISHHDGPQVQDPRPNSCFHPSITQSHQSYCDSFKY